MNKSKATFLFILFISFGLLGFLMMNGIKSLVSAAQTNNTSVILSDRTQQNFLLIHVDDLSADEPQLVAVWAVFFSPSKPAVLTFKSLYPSGNETTQDMALSDAFSLNEDRSINTKFFNLVKQYQFSWQGTIMMDHQAIQQFSDWLQLPELPLSVQQAIEIPGARIQPVDEITWFESFCAQIQTQNLHALQPMIWSEIIPQHMQTGLLFDQLILVWDHLAAPDFPPHCEVLSP